MKVGNSPPSVSRDGGGCLGPAGVTQSLEGGLNRNSSKSPLGDLHLSVLLDARTELKITLFRE